MFESLVEPEVKGSKISVVVPLHNEAQNIATFYSRISIVLKSLGMPWEIVFVNDGSGDNTLAYVLALNQKSSNVKVVDLSRNFGKEVAISAGMDYASGEAVVFIDADLQHPPEVIPDLVKKWCENFDTVFAVRRDRKHEDWFKRSASRFFYKIFGSLTDVPNHDKIGDFCLVDRRVLDVLRRIPERNRFMKGLFAWVGFKQDFVTYDLQPRLAGKTKWSYWRLWNFAIEGITSFSSIPLRVWTYFGFILSTLAFLYAIFRVIRTIIFGIDVPGYESLIVSILFMGGVQLISLGIIGEYIGRIYKEVKGRPLYIVRGVYGFEKSDLGRNERQSTAHSVNYAQSI